MADVSHTSAGYTGTVDQVAEAQRFVLATLPFRVNSSTDWAVTVNSSANLTVNIAAGAGMACGVRDATTTAATLTAAANASGSTRLDVIVASFNWTTGATSFGIVQGTTSLPAINTGGSVVATSVNRIPGVQYDAVLAVLQVRNGVGVLSTTDLFDSRVWGGMSGMGTIQTATYLSMVDARPGTELHAVDTKQRWRYDGSAWNWPRSAQGLIWTGVYSSASAFSLNSADSVYSAFGNSSLYLPANRHIAAHFTGMMDCDATPTVFFWYLQVDGVTINRTSTPMVVANIEHPINLICQFDTTTTGNHSFAIHGVRLSGTGNCFLTAWAANGPARLQVIDLGSSS